MPSSVLSRRFYSTPFLVIASVLWGHIRVLVLNVGVRPFPSATCTAEAFPNPSSSFTSHHSRLGRRSTIASNDKSKSNGRIEQNKQGRSHTTTAKTTTTSSSQRMSSTTASDTPVWDPVQQIYVGGNVPENAKVRALIKKGDGSLRLFGYGSLCWNPGTGALAHPSVTSTLGSARGYKRCWAQRSTDHRGVPRFPGIVCTLLTDEEVRDIKRVPTTDAATNGPADDKGPATEPTMTEGVIFLIPPEQVDQCLDELDFREKGGYARDVIEVVEDETGNTYEALLYRGTHDNPAIWPRVLRDLPYAAAVLSAAVGPSGTNDFYLHSLDEFLKHAETIAAKADDTALLTSHTKKFQERNLGFYFLVGCGSNQHEQLIVNNNSNSESESANVAALVNGEDAHELVEIALCHKQGSDNSGAIANDPPTQLFAGGGHSGLLTKSGRLFLWGWNENGQLGRGMAVQGSAAEDDAPFPVLPSLNDIRVADAALGFSHTLVIERETRRLLCFGSNERGQCDGATTSNQMNPVTPECLSGKLIASISAGLYHSSAVTEDGELYTFGCGRFKQCLSNIDDADDACVGSWKPDDGAKIVSVACGRRHTLVLDEKHRVWSFGENKFGQLGRDMPEDASKNRDGVPRLVDLSGVTDASSLPVKRCKIICGWSHSIVCVERSDGTVHAYGWGRNDKGQLGLSSQGTENILVPTQLFRTTQIHDVDCGSESTMVLDAEGSLHGCGWNEHGNLGDRSKTDRNGLIKTTGARIVAPHEGDKIVLAAGGAHVLCAKVVEATNE